jgi:hypothetical protein
MIVVIVATLASILGILVAHGMGNWEKIKDNWDEYRCNPMYIPVAGFIRPDVSTSDNFIHCTNTLASSIWGIVGTTYRSSWFIPLRDIANPQVPVFVHGPDDVKSYWIY